MVLKSSYSVYKNLRQLETALRANRHIKVRELSQMLGINAGTVYSILRILGYYKVAIQWISRLLTDKQKIVFGLIL